MTKYRKGQIVQIAVDNDNDSYEDKWRNKPLRITHVATSYGRGEGQHPGYDESAGSEGLYDLEDVETEESVPFSLYDWEITKR